MSEKHCAAPDAPGRKTTTLTGIIVPKSNVHPDFDDPRGDVILEDMDGLLYQVSGHMLGKKW